MGVYKNGGPGSPMEHGKPVELRPAPTDEPRGRGRLSADIRIAEINAVAARLEVIGKRVAHDDMGAMECSREVQRCADELQEVSARLDFDLSSEASEV